MKKTSTATPKPERFKLHLEDQGQDFLWFIVSGNTIEEAGPFQNSVWAGMKILPPDSYKGQWRKGSRVDFPEQGKGKAHQRAMRLNYPVIKVERLP